MSLVPLHAFPLDNRMWQRQSRTFDAIAPNILNIAQIDDAADHVAQLLDRDGIDRAVIAGLSRGAFIAMAFARRHPQRLSALVLCDTNAGLDPEPALRARYEMAERLPLEGIAFLPEIMLPRLLGTTSLQERPELVELVRNWILSQDPAVVAAAQIGMAERQDSRPILAGIRVPVLAIAGVEDSAHDSTRFIAQSVRLGRFVSIPRAGHLSNLEQPDAFDSALRQFLKDHNL